MTDKDSHNGRKDISLDATMAEPSPDSSPGSDGGVPESFENVEDKDFPKTLGKFYKVTRKIGEGGMGVVFEVEHTKMGKKFAAKIISRSYMSDRDAVKRFELEAVAASKIESPHIVQVTHLDTEGDYTYIIMELLKGRNLAALINKRAIPVHLAVEIARQVAKGLIAAHQAGIVHRDLKPENIFLINQEGELYVKILDFGISKIKLGPDSNVRLTKTGQIIGTPLYFSPEQARGMVEIDGRTDIYALGVILYEMVTGQPVFDATNPLELMMKHATQPPPRPTSIVSSIPLEVEKIILKCLSKTLDGRYQSAAELLIDLQGLQLPGVDRDTVSKATSLTDPLLQITDSTKLELSVKGRKGRSSRTVLAVIGVLVVLALVVGGYVFLTMNKGGKTDDGAGTKPVKGQTLPGDDGSGSQVPAEGKDAAEEQAPPAAEEVTLSLTSTPDGAEVWIGGELAGTTPFEKKLQKDGASYAVEIRAKNYRTETLTVQASADFSQDVQLKAAKGGKKTVKGGIFTEQ